MASYAIGDIHGCFSQFEQLIDQIEFNSGKDNLYLVGDVVNRGSQSLEVLRWIMAHDSCVQMVLGNHDLHLLAIFAGVQHCKSSDTLDDILNAHDSQKIFDWLRTQTLLITNEQLAIVHAGLLPEWSFELAAKLSEEVSIWLLGKKYRFFLTKMYGNYPASWGAVASDIDRWRIVVNSMTRMRMLNYAGELNLSYSGTLLDAPKNLIPWFKAPNRKNIEKSIVCGHWSALGLHLNDNIMAIDTGCLWGGTLSAICLDDKQISSVQGLIY